MSATDALCADLGRLRHPGGSSGPANVLGVVLEDGADHAVSVVANALGVAAYRGPRTEYAAAVLPATSDAKRPCDLELAARPNGFLERRLLLTGFPDDFQRRFGVRRARVLVLHEGEPRAAIVLGTGDPAAPDSELDAELAEMAEQVLALLRRSESAASQLDRLRRLEQVDALLPTLFQVLDVRDIFDRLSVISQDVLPHDVMAMGFFSEDGRQVETYAQATSPSRLPETGPNPWPSLQYEGWLCRVIDDLRSHPIEMRTHWGATAARSSIRLAVRLAGDVLGALNFSSNEVGRYTANDLAIGRHVADYLALAMSHQRLAEEASRAEELRLRASQGDLLDELLQAVTGEGELPDVFHRVSSLVAKVLEHDALLLSVPLAHRRDARLYARQPAGTAAFPDLVPVPRRAPQGDADAGRVIHDLRAEDDARHREAAERGYRSALRVPIRLEGEPVAELDVLSLAVGRYKNGDLPVARRIAERLSVSVARERSRAQERRADEASARAVELEARVRSLTEELNAVAGYHRVIGDSARWREVLIQATQVGPTETTVLLLGESGTGKEVVARFLHRASPRAAGPFVAINCAALPDQLLEAELFGYERGAFTGAMQNKAGQLEHAAGGTLFLDEVAEMSPSTQAKFLRVLQEREFKRLGSTRQLKADVRVVAATHRDLEKEMERGGFREDLYYRLNVFSVRLPPLRERRDDIAVLSRSFLSDISRSLGRPPAGLSQDAQRALLQYHWPGNVRELRNVLERAAILADGGLIVAEHFAFRPSRAKPEAASPASPRSADAVETGDTLESVERAMLEKALADARFNKSRAAHLLGITRYQLYAKLRRHGLDG